MSTGKINLNIEFIRLIFKDAFLEFYSNVIMVLFCKIRNKSHP